MDTNQTLFEIDRDPEEESLGKSTWFISIPESLSEEE